MIVIPALAIAYVVVVALLALVAWDEKPLVTAEPDTSRGVLPLDAY